MTLSDKILQALKEADKYPSQYFTAEDRNGVTCKIRVSNHSANRQNNGDTKTLSFVTATQMTQGGKKMTNEWVVDLENELTDTFQTIEEVLDWEDIDN
jgi:hypothetical protein